jgi:carboxyl-terminal processing protease
LEIFNLVKYRSTGFASFVTILLFSFLGHAQPGITSPKVQPIVPSGGLVALPPSVESISEDVRTVLSIIEENHVSGRSLSYDRVYKSTIDSALNTLDPHSSYFDARENEAFRADQNSRYYGIGATIGDLSTPDGKVIATYIKATFDEAPAHKAGLRYGDKIVSFSGPRALPDGTIKEIKDESMLGKSFSEVRSYLRGPEGTMIDLVVEHLDGKRETVTIRRGAVPQPSIAEAYMIRPGVGYISMRGGFNTTTYGEFVSAMRDLKANGMQQLVLDLRDNGGGLVMQAFRVAEAFLSEGQTVFTQRGRIELVNERYSARGRMPDRSPVVILVNRSTASASEILAGALQDHDRALIVGETTFGKGLVQNPIPLEHGSMLLLTIAKYQTPSGRQIQKDYSNGEIYNYKYDGGSLRDEQPAEPRPKGSESKTDTGRPVYSGGGIDPDVVIKPETIPIERARFQQKLANPVFAFAMDMVMGKVKGFEKYKAPGPITFEYDLKPTDLRVDEPMYAAFKQYAAAKYKFTPAQVDREREFIERALRAELVTSRYGSQTSFQVYNEYDDQLLKAIDLLPQARQLALQGERARLRTQQTNPRSN